MAPIQAVTAVPAIAFLWPNDDGTQTRFEWLTGPFRSGSELSREERAVVKALLQHAIDIMEEAP